LNYGLLEAKKLKAILGEKLLTGTKKGENFLLLLLLLLLLRLLLLQAITKMENCGFYRSQKISCQAPSKVNYSTLLLRSSNLHCTQK
jgi:hypothetical protein